MAATSLSSPVLAPSAARTRRFVRRYVAIGDSFTAGAEDASVAGGHSASLWADELAAALRPPTGEFDYHNLAVPGVMSTDVVARQLEPALRLGPDLISVFCGPNDVLLSVRPEIEVYRSALSEIFTSLQLTLPGTAIVTATCPDVSPFLPFRERSRERVARGIAELNVATLEITARHEVLCIDFAAHPQASERDNFAADGIHPSGVGSRRTAAAFARALDDELGLEIDRERLDG